MKKIQLILLTAITLLMTACGTTQTVPLTGRKHRIGVSDEQLLSLSQQQYSTYMQKAKKSTNAANTQMVVRVGRNLANAVETYLRNNGFASEVNNFHWEFNLIQDPQANAFCMPGGKIVVFEGILPYTQNEASLAIVLGHEIAHAVAKHSAEQMTKQQNQGVATTVLGSVLGAVAGQDAANVAGQIAGTGFSLLNLKYSRKDESEADYMGLIFAAMAGYDPANHLLAAYVLIGQPVHARVAERPPLRPDAHRQYQKMVARGPKVLPGRQAQDAHDHQDNDPHCAQEQQAQEQDDHAQEKVAH